MTWKHTESPTIPASDAFRPDAWQLVDAEGNVIGEFRELVMPEANHAEG